MSALFSNDSIDELVSEVFRKGYALGVKKHKELLNSVGHSFRELFYDYPGILYFLDEDTNIVVLKEHPDGQLEFVFYNCVDELTIYANYTITEVRETPKDITIVVKE